MSRIEESSRLMREQDRLRPNKSAPPESEHNKAAGDEWPINLVALSNRMWAYPAPAYEGGKGQQKYIRADKAIEAVVEMIMEHGDLNIELYVGHTMTGWRGADTAEVLSILTDKEDKDE